MPEVWLQVSPAQTAIHQPHSICTGSQLNDPQGVARTHLWISLPESNYSFGQTVHPQRSFGPLRLCAGVYVLGGNLSDCLTLRFSLCSSTLEPSLRCVDENWGGSLKSKVSPQLGHHYFFWNNSFNWNWSSSVVWVCVLISGRDNSTKKPAGLFSNSLLKHLFILCLSHMETCG